MVGNTAGHGFTVGADGSIIDDVQTVGDCAGVVYRASTVVCSESGWQVDGRHRDC